MKNLAGKPWAGRRLTVQGWFYLVLSLMSLLVLLGTVVGANLLNRTAEATDSLLKGVQPAQTEAYRLQSAMVNQETGIRGYAITADARFLKPYTDGKKNESESAARLRRLVAAQPELRDDLTAVERQAAQWRLNYAEPLVASVSPGRPKAVDLRTVEGGKEDFDKLRASWAKQNAHMARVVAEGRAHIAHERTLRNSVLVAMVAAFLLTGVALAVFVRLLVTRPLSLIHI